LINNQLAVTEFWPTTLTFELDLYR